MARQHNHLVPPVAIAKLVKGAFLEWQVTGVKRDLNTASVRGVRVERLVRDSFQELFAAGRREAGARFPSLEALWVSYH
jgi:hypothetical protein